MVRKCFTMVGFLVLFAVFLYGCSFGEPVTSFNASEWTPPPIPENASNPLGILNWTAGLSIIGGVIALVMTGGRMGARAIACGVALVILSYVVSAYLNWIVIPVIAIFTVISAVWGYQIILKAWKHKETR